MAGSQPTPVDDIADSDEALEKKVKEIVRHSVSKPGHILTSQQTGQTLFIEDQDTVGWDFLQMEDNVRAVLVRKEGGSGAFRVTGGETQNVVTGPSETGAVIVEIKAGQTGMCLGKPTIRRFCLQR